MTKAFLLLFVLLISSTKVFTQCATTDDIIVNETSINRTTHNLIEGSTHFSLELLRTLNNESEDARNVFFSPQSIWSALVVTYMGARGATEQEMRNVLGIGNSDKLTTWEAFKNIRNVNRTGLNSRWYKKFGVSDPSYKSANRIYFQNGTKLKNCMREIMKIDIEFLDFKSNPRASRKIINTWVKNQTQQRIKNLIPRKGIHKSTNMVIVNAVYFKEPWLQPFKPSKSERKPFTISSKHEIFVTMMSQTAQFLYGESEELHCYAVELPYITRGYSMIILLPHNRYSGVETVSNNLTPERLRNLLSDMHFQKVFVSIPKFKLEDNFELSEILRKMGLRTLFDPERVDLSDFTGIREFKVDEVYHKTFIDVNEKGTEAAAAAAVGTARSIDRDEPAIFIADYPFIFLIKDNLSNAILFLGIVRKPPEHGNN